ncbi:MAG: hypothetical protein EOO16_14100 [Chitinophagaceae bacterium]|nr:MAG: hypothetical protein EOO16_14100 [Chitinophagaceae bacterium]
MSILQLMDAQVPMRRIPARLFEKTVEGNLLHYWNLLLMDAQIPMLHLLHGFRAWTILVAAFLRHRTLPLIDPQIPMLRIGMTRALFSTKAP